MVTGLPEVRERVPGAVRVVLDGDGRDVPEGGAGPRHPRPRDDPRQRGHRRPVRALVGVDRAADQLRDPGRREMGHLLAADDEDGAIKTGRHRGVRREQGGGARRGRRLGAEARHPREAEVGRHVGGEVALADELLGVHGRDHEGVGPLQAGGREGAPAGLRHEVGQRVLPPPDPGHGRPRDVDVAHAASRTAPAGWVGCAARTSAYACSTGRVNVRHPKDDPRERPRAMGLWSYIGGRADAPGALRRGPHR